MKLYQQTDSDRRSNLVTCGADRRMETVYTFDTGGDTYDELHVTITVNGDEVYVGIYTEKCGPKVAVWHNGQRINTKI